jgi:hypothetical protein
MMCHVEYDSYATVWRETWISKSRKPHQCDTCHTTIPVGSRYLSIFCVYEGDASSDVQCQDCAAIAKRFADEHKVGSPFPSSLLDFLDSCADYGDEDSQRWRAACDEIRARQHAATEVR